MTAILALLISGLIMLIFSEKLNVRAWIFASALVALRQAGLI